MRKIVAIIVCFVYVQPIICISAFSTLRQYTTVTNNVNRIHEKQYSYRRMEQQYPISYYYTHLFSSNGEQQQDFFKVLRLHLGKSFCYNIDDHTAYIYRYSLLLLHIIRYLFSQSILSISKDLNQVNSISYLSGQHLQLRIGQLWPNTTLMVCGYGHNGPAR